MKTQQLWQKAKKHFARQLEEGDCGTSALLSILQFYGRPVERQVLRYWSGSVAEGSTLLGLSQAASRAGWPAQGYQGTLSDLACLQGPCLLHICLPSGQGHFWVCYGKAKQGWVIGEPSRGVIHLSDETLSKHWQSGALLYGPPVAPKENMPPAPKLWALLGQALRAEAWALVSIILLGGAIALLGLATSIGLQMLVDTWLPSGQGNYLAGGLGFMAWLLLLRIALQYGKGRLLLRLSKNWSASIMNRLFGHALALPLRFHRLRTHADWMARIRDAQQLQQFFGLLAGQSAIDLLSVAGGLALLGYYHPYLAALGIIALPLYWQVAQLAQRRLVWQQHQTASYKALSDTFHLQALQAADALQLGSKEAVFQAQSRKWHGHWLNAWEKTGLERQWLQSGLESIGMASLLSLMGLAAYLVHAEQLRLGEFMGAMSAWGVVSMAGHRLGSVYMAWQEKQVVFERLKDLLQTTAQPARKAPLGQWRGLVGSALARHFPGTASPLWQHLNFAVFKGETIGIIGENGQGKTALLEVMQGIYQPEEGTLHTLWEGDSQPNPTPLHQLPPKSWQAHLGVVPQKLPIFKGSLLDNIRLFDPAHSAEDVVRQCHEWGLHRFFEALPAGYSTMVGEGGVRLSGGQCQLVGLARALLQHPSILLLDEPYAGLSPDAIRAVQAVLLRLQPKLGIVLISHHESLLNGANRIYRLSKTGFHTTTPVLANNLGHA